MLDSRKHFFQAGPIRVRPVHRPNVFQLSSDVIGTLSYNKFEIVRLQREGSAAKCNVSGKMPYIL